MSTVDRLLRLWTEPVPETGDAIAAFGAVYADPVSINGVDVPLVGLVDRARTAAGIRGSQRGDHRRGRGAEPARCGLLAARPSRRPARPPLGEIAPTGRHVEVRTIDVLSISADRISAVQVVPDNLGLAMQLGAVALAQHA
jgi:hypothetical protein